MNTIKTYHNFRLALGGLALYMRDESKEVHTERWQGMVIQDKPEARMRELCFVAFQVPNVPESLGALANAIGPNLPWADDHFEQERVSGEPVNPGETWKTWPWGHSADKFRTEGEGFNHSYAERYWPKHAGQTEGGRLGGPMLEGLHDPSGLAGIRYRYGDLNDVVDLLAEQPLTRQAYLPVFFPEDTGAVHRGRIPCSIGYHFLRRDSQLHIVYQLRSCDFYRHLRDDIYLTARLLLWVLDRLREKDPEWNHVLPGSFTMMISSLHMFENDYRKMFKK